MNRIRIAVLLSLLVLTSTVDGQEKTIELNISSDKDSHQNLPVCVPLSLPKQLADNNHVSLEASGMKLPGQLTTPGLTTQHIKSPNDNEVRRDLHFVLPTLKAGSVLHLKCSLSNKVDPKKARFEWKESGGSYTELYWVNESGDTRPMLRYMHKKYDDSSPEVRNKTYKVFHHLYDPAGKRLVTNGGHTDPHDDAKKLLFPHHRGLMYGFNKVTYGDNKKADTWHCQGDDYVEHVKTISQEAGPVLGRHRVLLDWHGSKTDIFAREEREMTVYAIPGGTLVEFASLLKTTGGKVILDGDPQHAGFQFRAANEVAEKSAKQTYYLRVGGKGKPGETINWDGKNPQAATVNVPWKAMSFVLGQDRYTAAYLGHPKNPKESRHSERDYGRFGCYFTWNLTGDNPLLVTYRIWLQNGEMTGPQVEALHRAFASPPTVSVK